MKYTLAFVWSGHTLVIACILVQFIVERQKVDEARFKCDFSNSRFGFI